MRLAFCKENGRLSNKRCVLACEKPLSVIGAICKNLLSCCLSLSQVYVVFSEELDCWCRALVESVWPQAEGYQLRCFLVDYARYCSVASEKYVLKNFCVTVMYLLID